MTKAPFGASMLASFGAAAVVAVVAYQASRTVDIAYRAPDPFFVVPALAALVVMGSRVGVWTWGWWLWGAATLFWSLAPGNTHVASLWELTYLAAFAAAWWRPLAWAVVAVLGGNALIDMLSLNAFGLEQYISGSVHYVGGAMLLALVPLALAGALRATRLWQVAAWTVPAGLALYGAVASGARAVYLPLALVAVVAVVRALAERVPFRNVAITVLGAAVVVVCLEAVQPWRPLATALNQKATLESQVDATGDHGSFRQRLRYWDQTLDIALANPLGAGNGSYEAVIHSYQKYPMAWSNSPHNYYVETLANGGWPRLALLLGMLVLPLWRAWRSRQWQWALAAAGVWLTLAFDVTSYYPSFMMFAFLTLGATYHSGAPDGRLGQGGVRLRALVPWVCVAVGAALAAWWFLPCEGQRCFIDRYHGAEYLADEYLDGSDPAQAESVIVALRRLYPQSLWVLRLEQQGATDPQERLRLAREIATRFPYQSPFNYLEWAEAALAVGDRDEAGRAIRAGREVFAEGEYPYGEFRMTRDLYQQWIDASDAILRGDVTD